MAVGNPWINEIARINSVINQTLRNIARDQALLAANPNGPNASTLRTQIESGEAFLVDLRAQLQIFQTEYQAFGRDSTASAGQVVAEAARAKDDGAATSNPATPTSVLAPTGRINPNNVESGTDALTKTQVQTQATPPSNNGTALPFITGDDDGNPVPGIPTTQAGAAANRDDNTAPNSNRPRYQQHEHGLVCSRCEWCSTNTNSRHCNWIHICRQKLRTSKVVQDTI
jgi:hypothetical protein